MGRIGEWIDQLRASQALYRELTDNMESDDADEWQSSDEWPLEDDDDDADGA